MENWLSINSQWGECIRIWKSLMGESGKFLLWHNKIFHSPKTINNNHQPLYKLSYLLNSANSALLFPDGVKRYQIVFVRCIFCPVRLCDMWLCAIPPSPTSPTPTSRAYSPEKIKTLALTVNIWKSYMWIAVKETNMEAIFAVTNTT